MVETVKAHAPQLPHGATGSSTGAGSGDSLTHKVSQSGETLVHSAQNLASQATTYAQHGIHQIVEKLPESVSSKLPAQITSIGVGGTTEKEHAATGKEAYDFTTTHTTANFEASGKVTVCIACLLQYLSFSRFELIRNLLLWLSPSRRLSSVQQESIDSRGSK